MARSITFTVEGTVDTRITVTELDDGTLRFDIQVLGSGSIGDLRGIFFDLEGYTADASLTATGADVTTEVSGEGSVDSVQKDVNLKGEVTNTLGDFDIGIEFGTSGMSGDDIQSTSFVLSDPDQALTLDMLNLADFGLRFTSVGEEDGTRTDSAKIGGESSGVAQNDALAADENGSNSVNLLVNDQNSGNTVSSVSLNGTNYATGTAIALTIGGLTYGTLTVQADGTATLDATGLDVDSLSAIQSVSFDLIYTSVAPDGSSATAGVQLRINGVNDAPVITAGGQTTGAVAEDGTLVASGDLDATDADANASLTWSVTGGGGGLLGALSVDANGSWTYTLDNDNPLVQAMAAGDSHDEVFEIVVTDEFGAQDSQLVTVTVTGAADGPTIDNSWVGTIGADNFYGYPGNTQIDALAGNDWIVGDYYSAQMGSSWNGSAYVDFSSDPIFGDDVIEVGPGYDRAMGDAYQLQVNNYYSLSDRGFATGSDSISGDTENDGLSGDVEYSYLFHARSGTTISIDYGADTVSGGDGNDYVTGDATAASVQYTDVASQAWMACGDDNLAGDDGVDQVFGDAVAFSLLYNYGGIQNLTGGNDTIDGGLGADYVYGDASDFYIYHTAPGGTSQVIAGHDWVDGGADHDEIYGDALNARIQPLYSAWGANTGTAEVIAGNDTLFGGDGSDIIYGDFNVASYYSGSTLTLGADIIDGGAGNDALWGDMGLNFFLPSDPDADNGVLTTGADTFVFATGSGLDTIHDFEVGQDLIDVTGYGITSLAGLTITDDGFSTTIDFDGSAADIDEVVLLNRVGLTASDFIFA